MCRLYLVNLLFKELGVSPKELPAVTALYHETLVLGHGIFLDYRSRSIAIQKAEPLERFPR